MKGSFTEESASHQYKMLKTETNQLRPAGCGKSWMHPAERASAPSLLVSLSLQMSSVLKKDYKKIPLGYSHRMVRVGRELPDDLISTALTWTEECSIRSVCSEPHPTWPQTLPGMGHSQFL